MNVEAPEGSDVRYRDIVDFPGYRVGDDGSVWSCWRRGAGRGLGAVWRRMKPHLHGSGYPHLNFRGQGGRVIHRLVLEAFVGPCPEGMVACHFPDPDHSNNRLSNLRWDTTAANQRDKEAHGHAVMGESHGGAKLTNERVRAIRAEYEAGAGTMREVGAMHGISFTQAQRIIRREAWKHVA